ncbi:MAG: hypothetical protein NTW19_02170 [Planctomycetota bacterium]|nr:hypothetical protein [Planctomycetota bacterium]
MRACLAVLSILVASAFFTAPAEAQRPVANPPPPAPVSPLIIGYSGRAGIGFYRSDSWAQVGVSLLNRTTEPVELMVVVSLVATPSTQYATKVWLPPLSTRRVIQPVRTAKTLSTGDVFATKAPAEQATTQVYEIKGDTQTLLFTDNTDIQLNTDRPTTGVFADSSDEIPGMGLAAARLGANWTSRLFFFRPADSPPSAAGLASLDSMVIARPRPDLDGAQIAALRQWLVRGGRLWVMLDRVNPEFLEQLLGEDWDVTVVDNVELSRVQVQGMREAPWSREFEKPVLFTRTIPHGMEVLYTIDGWPAAYRKSIGRGTLLVTTLAGNGWIKPDRSASTPLTSLAGIGMRQLQPSPVPVESMTRATLGQIGYKILGRGTVIFVLGGFCLLLAGGGLWLMRAGRLDLLAPSGAGLAVVTALFFIVVGSAQRQVTPATLASEQYVEVVPSQGCAIVNSVVGIYSPNEEEISLSGVQPEALLPNFSTDQGRVHRLNFLDLDRWRWDGVAAQSGGVRMGELSTAESLSSPVTARVKLGENGLAGRLEAGPIAGLRGIVLASTAGLMVPKVDADGAISASESLLSQRGRPVGPAPRDEFETRQREIVTQLLGLTGFPATPVLLGWSDGFDDGLSMGPSVVRRKGAVVAVPLQLETAEPGEKLAIPAIFMTPRPAGVAAGLLFDPMQRRWVGQRIDTANETLGFQIPAQAMPFQPEAGRLMLDLTAPRREVEIETVLKGKAIAHVATLSSPAGLVTIVIPPEAGMAADAEGIIGLRIKIGAPSGVTSEMPPTWTLGGAALEITGTVGTRR